MNPASHVAVIRENVVPGKRLGRHVEHDPQSRGFAHAELPQPALRSASWKRHGGPFDQGSLGSCTGNALAGALMTEPLYVPGRELGEADAVAIYEVATTIDEFPGSYPPDDTGSSGLAVCKAGVQKGLMSRYEHAFGLEAAVAALMRGPVIVGINWYSSFDDPSAHGHVSIARGAVVRGGHEVQAYRTELHHHRDGTLDLGASRIHFWNSWGPGWGLGGSFSMTLACFSRLLREGGDVTVPLA